jgi:hypothetical protein
MMLTHRVRSYAQAIAKLVELDFDQDTHPGRIAMELIAKLYQIPIPEVILDCKQHRDATRVRVQVMNARHISRFKPKADVDLPEWAKIACPHEPSPLQKEMTASLYPYVTPDDTILDRRQFLTLVASRIEDDLEAGTY